ncbi:c-type cytochrome [Phenylobacterium montanum]|uniref:Cytochrome c n=1 Tax=Phenylobacterium montanum TaxID=2823693 RepID=A0A975FX46_9CAUL|nr:cytochrome c [Caulobacter sp. S6]QUD86442.1 cytochrome c [Caulobacter sp. S6]
MKRFAGLMIAVAAFACAGLVRSEPADVAFGRRIAQRNCGACHAIGAGRSPNAAAPPFRDLHRRYGPGGLDALLSEGMLAPADRSEEGSSRYHPRMPHLALDEDEVAALKAFLHSLEPVRKKAVAEP